LHDRDSISSIIGRLKNKEELFKEYQVLEDEPGLSFEYDKPWIFGDEHADGIRVKKKFLSQYEGIRLEDAIKGEPVANEIGECYAIKSSFDFSSYRIDREIAKRQILSDLKLLKGIGVEKEKKLKAQGYRNIEDLQRHPIWGKDAKRLIEMICSCSACELQKELWHWLPKSHPLNLHISAFADMENMLALDIETMGLFSRPIILFGAAYINGDKIETIQFLARDIEEEAAAISEFCDLLEDRPLLSYNGRAFDVPYINQRRWYYELGRDIDNIHFDMLPFARRAFKNILPDSCLKTVERHLFGMERADDVPGILVPEFYEEYLNSGNPGPLVPIVEHNRQDILTLAMIFSKFCEEACKDNDR
jgi:hypothetical protein